MNSFRPGDAEPLHSVTPSEDAAAAKQSNFYSELWEWIKSIFFALAVVWLSHQFLFNLSSVKGHSMDPTLQDGEWLFVNRAIHYVGSYDRGDVVILKDPDMHDKEHQFLVKRLVALPGDTVEVRGGKLYVNGETVDEPYTEVQAEDGDFGPYKLEDGQYFVMGDNRHRNASKDSRIFGAVHSGLIEGRAEWIIWPIPKIGGL